MTPFSESAAHRLRLAYLQMHRVTNRVMRAHGVTADQYVVLRLLNEADGVTQQELSKSCGSDPTTVGRMLDLLEKKRLVVRRPDDSDRRARLVCLTKGGRAKVMELYAAAESVRDFVNEAMTPETMDRLEAIGTSFENWGSEPVSP